VVWIDMTHPQINGRKFPKAVVFNKKIYVFGGYQGYKNDFVKIVECYDEETNE